MSKLSNSKKSNPNFFYASEDASIYDATVRLTDRAYDMVHESVIDTLVAWTGANKAQSGANNGIIVDVGCGTGAEAMRILEAFPKHHLLCIDSSAEMLNEFSSKIVRTYGEKSAGGRLTLTQADVRCDGWLANSIKSVTNHGWPRTCVAIVSVYMLHHFSSKEKLAIYREIERCLHPSGAFINADLFSFDLPWLAHLAQQKEEDWIIQQFTKPSAEFAGTIADLGAQRQRLKKEWIKHLRLANRPLRIGSSSISPSSKPARIDSEIAILKQAGFSRCECLFRLYQSGVLFVSK